jgi:hypothetical protein
MEFVIRFRQSARSFRSSLHRLWRASPSYAEINRPFLVIDKDRRSKWSGRRLKVIRRDRYRCRGCDRRGDEVTLEIHQIQSGASDVAGMLALCPNCRELANALGLCGVHIPDFLRQLWCHLHHSVSGTDPAAGSGASSMLEPVYSASLLHLTFPQADEFNEEYPGEESE